MKKSLFFYSLLVLLVASCGETKETNTEDSNQTSATENFSPKEAEGIAATPPKLFYWDYNESKGIEQPFVVSLDSALMLMEDLPPTDGNFLGLELPDGSLVQFMNDAVQGLLLDIPNPVTMHSFQSEVTIDESLDIIREVYKGKTAADIQAQYAN